MADVATAPELEDVDALIADMGRRARAAAAILAATPTAAKAAALDRAAVAIRASETGILQANDRDMAAGQGNGLTAAMLDRLKLDPKRIAGIAAGLEAVARLDDPVGAVIDRRTRPNGMEIERVRVPLGVVAIIYESRPNVTADAGALCLMSGNAVILRGGSEAIHSSRAIHAAMVEGIVAAGLPTDAVQLVPTIDRAAVGALLRASGLIDMVVPRSTPRCAAPASAARPKRC
jgi:glutamate-5-semialdehyde dehydrogenase